MACTFLSLVQLLLQWRQTCSTAGIEDQMTSLLYTDCKISNFMYSTESKLGLFSSVMIRKINDHHREMKDFDPEEVLESGISQTWPEVSSEAIPGTSKSDIELKELKDKHEPKEAAEPKSSDETPSQASSPERPPEVTSAVRRRSSVGIQRQASVCLSDDEDQLSGDIRPIAEKSPGRPHREVTKVSAIVHRSGNDKPLAHSWDQTSVGSVSSQPTASMRHPPFIHSHSSPDSRSTATAPKQGRLLSTFSLRALAADNLARVVDLEEYHYSRQQLCELASQGATLLQERSQSSLDVTAESEGWKEVPSKIQQAASTEAGLLEEGLEQHQLEHLRSLLSQYSPVDEEDSRSWSKVRYNDTGSREDIREEVIEMISGESEDDSNSSIERDLVKQQYKKLWELRATLEEEEKELGERLETSIEVEEETELAAAAAESAVKSEESEIISSQITSFESASSVDPGDDCDEEAKACVPQAVLEMRRHSLKNLLTKRLHHRTSSDPHSSTGGGGESSIESVDSSSTDRTEGATTSFDSTTDNTDSAGEGQTNRLQQMKADSGYKSMESNGKAPRLSRKQLQFALDTDSLDTMTTFEGSMEGVPGVSFERVSFETFESEGKDVPKSKCTTDTAKETALEGVVVGTVIPVTVEIVPEKKKSKSALKKHRTESDIRLSDQQMLSDVSSDTRSKTSVFQRFFGSGRWRCDTLQLLRDYSIDEKSDALFREFSKPDVHEADYTRSRSGRLHGHIRLHHRSSLPSTESSSSPHLGGKTVLSPQLSIEEESCESDEEHHSTSGKKEFSQHVGEDLRSPQETQAQIPVIYLSQGREERPT